MAGSATGLRHFKFEKRPCPHFSPLGDCLPLAWGEPDALWDYTYEVISGPCIQLLILGGGLVNRLLSLVRQRFFHGIA